jgi:hypothetical protein
VSSRPALPPARRIGLARPDLSAKEAIAIVLSVLRDGGLDVVPVDLRVQGAADRQGRLSIGSGTWDFLFWWEKQHACVEAHIVSNGNFAAGYVWKPFWQKVPPALGRWVDSTLAAEVVARELVLPGFRDNDAFFFDLTRHGPRQLWQVARAAYDVETSTARTHTFLLDIETATIVREKFKQQTGRKVVESWQHDR